VLLFQLSKQNIWLLGKIIADYCIMDGFLWLLGIEAMPFIHNII